MMAKMVSRELMDPLIFAKFKSFFAKVLNIESSSFIHFLDSQSLDDSFYLWYKWHLIMRPDFNFMEQAYTKS